MQQPVFNYQELNKYCVVCGREFGPHLESHCTPNSLVAVQKEGFVNIRTRYFDSNGKELSESDLSQLKESQTAWLEEWKRRPPVSRPAEGMYHPDTLGFLKNTDGVAVITPTTNEQIINRPISATIAKIIIGTLIISTATYLGAFFSMGTSLFCNGSFIGCILALVFVRGVIFGNSDPLDKKRWERYWTGDLIGYWISYIGLMFLLPVLLQSYISSGNTDINRFLGLDYILASIIGFGSGMFFVFINDGKDKKNLFSHATPLKNTRVNPAANVLPPPPMNHPANPISSETTTPPANYQGYAAANAQAYPPRNDQDNAYPGLPKKKKWNTTVVVIGIVTSAIALVCVCGVAFFVLTPTAAPAATSTPVPTPTTVPTIEGFKLFRGSGMSLMLPDSFTGGNTTTDMDLLIENLKKLGPQYAEMVPEIERSRDAIKFLAYDLTNVVKNNGFTNSVLVTQEELFSGMTIEIYMKNTQDQLLETCNNCTFSRQMTLPINGYSGGRFDSTDSLFNVQINQIYYIIKIKNTFWGVVFTAEGSNYETYEPLFEKSIQTFTIQ